MKLDQLPAKTRRTVLAGLGAVGVGAMASGNATASNGNSNSSGNGSDESEHAAIGFPPEHLTEWGEPVEIGNGEATTFITFNSADQPMLLGVHMPAATLRNLGNEMEHFSLQFPDSIDQTQFEWLELDWNPQGHGPPGVYLDIPHFDFHFYLLSEDEVHDIPPINFPPGESDEESYMEPIPADQFPPNYFREGSVVPQMGEHLVDATAVELTGGEFTNTFIWGHWENNLHFFEPMVTVEYFNILRHVGRFGGGVDFLDTLLSIHGQDTREIPMPERMPEAGHYPTEYSVRYHADDDAFTVTLERFESFDASEGVQNDE